jgi:hypothetical protein
VRRHEFIYGEGNMLYHPVLTNPTLYILVKLLTLAVVVMFWWLVTHHVAMRPHSH